MLRLGYSQLKKTVTVVNYLDIYLYVNLSVLHSLIFVQNTEGVQEGKVSCNALKVLLRNIAIMVMVIIPKHRLTNDKGTNYSNNISKHRLIHLFNQKLVLCIL